MEHFALMYYFLSFNLLVLRSMDRETAQYVERRLLEIGQELGPPGLNYDMARQNEVIVNYNNVLCETVTNKKKRDILVTILCY